MQNQKRTPRIGGVAHLQELPMVLPQVFQEGQGGAGEDAARIVAAKAKPVSVSGARGRGGEGTRGRGGEGEDEHPLRCPVRCLVSGKVSCV